MYDIIRAYIRRGTCRPILCVPDSESRAPMTDTPPAATVVASKSPGEPLGRSVSVRFTDQQLNRAQVLARVDDSTVGEVIREALDHLWQLRSGDPQWQSRVTEARRKDDEMWGVAAVPSP